MNKQPSITIRLALFFAIASAITLICVGTMVGWAMNRHFRNADAAELDGKLELITHAIDETRDATTLKTLPQRLNDALLGHHLLSVTVSTLKGEVLLQTGKAHFPAELLNKPLNGGRIIASMLRGWENDKGGYQGIAILVPSAITGGAPYRVAMAIDTSEHEEFTRSVRRTIWLSIGFGIVATGLLARLIAYRGLAPLRHMTELAQGISADQLSSRLPIESVPLELNELTKSFNDMLSRLEDSFRRLSDFSSDIAHELRTPIGNLMTQTQVALTKTRDAEEYQEILYSNLEEYQRLSAMISDMLFLAKSDNGLIIPSREPVDLAAEITDLFSFYEALAEDRGIALSLNGQGKVLGDRLMLRRAVSNLLSNALRYTPRGGTVSVTLGRTEHGFVSIAVENPGEPIAESHLPRIFDRFYRADPSRRHDGEGAGLGLAITQSIVRAHGGQAAVRSGKTTCFELQLPGNDQPYSTT